MEKLSDFKPLERVVLPELGDLDCSGLILLVGPNSSGKTQLLRDLYHRTKGDSRKFVVAQEIKLGKPEFEPFLSCLEREGYIERVVDGNGTRQFRPKTTYVGTGEPAAQAIPEGNAQVWHQSYVDSNPASQQAWLSQFGRFVVTALFLDRRLISVNEVGVIDFLAQPPQNDLQVLYQNDEARNQLFSETQNTFGKAVWPDASRGAFLSLRVGQGPEAPTPADRLSPRKSLAYRTIEFEGDGLKSYVATCIAILLGRRPVCLIDEPEMCLHPPQAYRLGRFIGQFGSGLEAASLVATHSSHLLRGVIETAQRLQIVRLTRRGEAFEAHLVQAEALKEALKKPAVRAESVLDGIFSEAVVVVEADTDRAVYQATWETLQGQTRPDIHFSTVGGLGGIAHTCSLYRTLKIPVAVIADLDILVNCERLGQVLESLVDGIEVGPLVEHAKEIGNRIRLIPPTVAEDRVKDRLREVASSEMHWSKGDDAVVAARLRNITNDLDRMKRLKTGGVASLPPDLRCDVESLIGDLFCHGLFLVPVGELEQWFDENKVSLSKQDKSAWANAAATYIHSVGPQEIGVWKFITGVARYLTQCHP
jgi:hypothetical protein